MINGKVVSELDMVYVETLLHESRTLFLTVRSMRTYPPASRPGDWPSAACASQRACPAADQLCFSSKSMSNLTGACFSDTDWLPVG